MKYNKKKCNDLKEVATELCHKNNLNLKEDILPALFNAFNCIVILQKKVGQLEKSVKDIRAREDYRNSPLR